MAAMKGLALISGGMDSVTMLHHYQEDIQECVSFDYGSKHNSREYSFAITACAELSKPLTYIDLEMVIGKHFQSDLLKSGGEIPEGHYADETMKRTVVPFRNGIMLAIAAGLAESRGCDSILIANHAGDHAIYPDCRPEFIGGMRVAIDKGTYANVRLLSPYCNMTKRDIALKGKSLGVEYTLTWSCYKGDIIHCGRCGTCIERKEALEGFDSTVYDDPRDWKAILEELGRA